MYIYDAIAEFGSYLQFEKRFSEHTVVAYTKDLEQFAKFARDEFACTDATEVTSSVVRSWLAISLKDREKLNARSINRKISSLKALYKYLLRQHVVATSPVSAIISQKTSKRLPQFVDKKDMEKLWRYTDFPNTWQGRTEYLILSVFYQTGMRLAEVLNLKENNVDQYNSSLKILGKGNKERIIPCGAKLIEELLAYKQDKVLLEIEADRTVLFISEKGKKLYPKWLYNCVRKYLDPATTIEKRSPHVLRHTFATHLMNEGADLNAVKELLGHASLASTQVYTHNTIEKLKDVYKQAHPKA